MSPLSIYQLTRTHEHEMVHPLSGQDWRIFASLDGSSLIDTWTPVPVKRVRVESDGRRLQPADLPFLGSHVLVLNPRAVDALESLLEQCGEFLPLECADADLVVYNPLRIVDALDIERSELHRLSSGRIYQISRHVFRPGVIRGIHAFKVPEMTQGRLFVSEAVVDAARRAGLVGTDFEVAWSED